MPDPCLAISWQFANNSGCFDVPGVDEAWLECQTGCVSTARVIFRRNPLTLITPKQDPKESAKRRPALVYVRVSTARQASEGISLEAQERLCRARAEALGCEVVAVFSDAGASGKDDDRPGFGELRAANRALIKAGEEPVIVAYSISRISRRLASFCRFIDPSQDGLAIVSVTEPFDMSTPIGRAMAGMIAVFSQLEGEMASERTRDALAQASANGVRLGGARTASDTLPAEVLKLIHDLTDQGMSQRRIAEELTLRGIPTVTGKGRWTYDNVGRAQRVPRPSQE